MRCCTYPPQPSFRGPRIRSGQAAMPSWWRSGGRRYHGDMHRRQILPWERSESPHRSHTPDGWGRFIRWGHGFLCSPQPSMGQSYVSWNGGNPPSYSMASIHLTCRPIATAERQSFLSAMTYTSKRAALSRGITMSSVMG